jgi:uncharacterized protein (DUF885 family)
MLLAGWLIASCPPLQAQARQGAPPATAAPAALQVSPAPESGDIEPVRSEIAPFIERYLADRISLQRFFSEGGGFGRFGEGAGGGFGRARGEGGGGAASRFSLIDSWPERRERMRRFYSDWLKRLDSFPFQAFSQDGRIDYLLFRNLLNHELREVELRAKDWDEAAPMFPFAATIMGLEDSRRRLDPMDGAKLAATLTALVKDIEKARPAVESSSKGEAKADAARRKTVANRAGATVNSLRTVLRNWFNFYNGYDPVFTWWVAEPYKAADKSLQNYASFLTERLAGVKPDDPEALTGNPIGREALLNDLAYEMIPYTPEELVRIANSEFAWCEAEMKKASRDMGFGDDWKKALEKVKTLHVEPGRQPQLIRELALEAEEFVKKQDLVTVPELASRAWRMEMMSPERQLVNPFFLGGETITVSFPTNTMTQEQKEMSMRGNNIHFSRATVFHELIPGHNLQGFMAARYRAYRAPFSTAFLTEGWSLYWEMLLWDMNYARSPEDRVGMLFWRMHRCARIIFSLGFHLGAMTEQQAVDFLVDRVGHERDNAAAEVRRSFNGSYPPLYQAAYMLGGLQLRALRRELVDSGRMTNRAFHDAVLKENRIPVEMIRASLTGQKLDRDFHSNWRFYPIRNP